MEYIVMECHFSYAVLLDEDGKFYKAANRSYEVGQRVKDPVIVDVINASKRAKKRSILRLSVLLSVLLIVFLTVFAVFAHHRSTTVTLNIGEEITIESDFRGNVKDVSDRSLWDSVNSPSKKVWDLAASAVAEAYTEGKIAKDGRVNVNISAKDNDFGEEIGERIAHKVAVVLDPDASLTVAIYDGDELEVYRIENGTVTELDEDD
jgi:hypothetical protein